MSGPRQHIVIAGAGTVGLAQALALRHVLGGSPAITVLDPALAAPRVDGRALAIAPASRRLLRRLGAWAALADEAQPIRSMSVGGSLLDTPIRPALLDFEPGSPDEPVAHMIETAPLAEALFGLVKAADIDLRAAGLDGLAPDGDQLTLRAGSSTLEADLLVGADGAASPTRALAGIATGGWDYAQTGIVATVSHELEHDGRARQHFLPAGPFAILPLKGRRSSIVWSEGRALARRLLALDEAAFTMELERRFGPELGACRLEGPARGFPLRLRIARRFVGPMLALVGDAAHVLHPLAGQGVNLGLRDVAALADSVAETMATGLPTGHREALAAYERWRRFDTVAMGLATDALNRLFSNEVAPVRALREIGLSLMDRMPGAKRLIMREAAGGTGVVPSLLR